MVTVCVLTLAAFKPLSAHKSMIEESQRQITKPLARNKHLILLYFWANLIGFINLICLVVVRFYEIFCMLTVCVLTLAAFKPPSAHKSMIEESQRQITKPLARNKHLILLYFWANLIGFINLICLVVVRFYEIFCMLTVCVLTLAAFKPLGAHKSMIEESQRLKCSM